MNSSNNVQVEIGPSDAGNGNLGEGVEARLNILEMMFRRMDNAKDRDVYNTILIEKLAMIIDISVSEIMLFGPLSQELKGRITELSELIKLKLVSLLSSLDEYNKRLDKIEKRDEKSKKNKKKWKKGKKKWRKKVNKKAKKKVKRAKKKAKKSKNKSDKKLEKDVAKNDKKDIVGLNNTKPTFGNLAEPSIKIFKKDKEKIDSSGTPSQSNGNQTVINALAKSSEVMI
uniref:Uncharacterized protein n=1 Tax=Pithovirus LCPAC202 TaxID=2506592 RepID=A0A481Z5T9_9VIRU|nr:MAG: hypothetical protein LCPAC202_02370 [Pithovirus LCPAC202]